MKQISKNIYAIGSSIVLFNKDKKMPMHTTPKTKKENGDGDRWCNWGDDNLYPQRFMRKLKNSGTAVGGLEVLTSSHFGVGFRLVEEVETEGLIDFRERSTNSFPEIAKFFQKTKFNILSSDIIADFEMFKLAFPEYITTPNSDKIISVKRHKAADCRFGVPNKYGLIDKIYINTDWENYSEDYITEIPCFDASIPISEIKEYCKKNSITKFTIPIIDTLSVEKIYPLVGWHSSFRNGWLDVVLSIPELKKHIFEQQLNIKYLVHVSDEYFSHKYGQQTWLGFGADKQDELRKELVEAIDTQLSGNKAGGRSLISPFFRDKNGNEVKGIQIEIIEQNLSNGEFLLDASAGNSEILFPMGVDPCLLGAGIPGGKNLSGSGSDKREAYTILCSRLPVKQIRTLQVFENIKEWNGWQPTLYGKFPNINLTTLDKNPNGQTKVIN